MKLLKWYFLLGLFVSSIQASDTNGDLPLTPLYRIEETLVSYRGASDKDYLAFPSIVSLGGDQIMLSYKRGEKHLRDPGAALEIVRFDLSSGSVAQSPIQIGAPDLIMQMGEWIRFPNQTLSTYIDVQKVDEQGIHYRAGLMQATSNDDGRTFSALSKVGSIDGVEYGYLFDSVARGKRVYVLAMTFENLEGGRRTVDALYTDDNGSSWRFLRNLNREFGDIRINESSLIEFKDGFIVATRGYDGKARLHKVDINFRLQRESNITDRNAFISSHIGRPRLFTMAGQYFLIGRNHRAPAGELPMEQGLFRFDPESLEIEKQYVLDNIEQGDVTDGYYPCPILVDVGERTFLNVFDYKAILGNSPDIIRLQFDIDAFGQ